MSLYQFTKKYSLTKVPLAVNGQYLIYYGAYKDLDISISVVRKGNYISNIIKIYGDFKNQDTIIKVNTVFNGFASLKYVKNFSIGNSIYIELAKPVAAVKCDEFEFVLDKINEALKDTAYIKNKCELCGGQDENHLLAASDRDELLYLCKNCYNELGKKYENANTETAYQPNNYVSGILLGLLFSLIGVVIWVLVGMIGFIAGIAGFAVVYFMYLGYKKGGGKVNKTAAVLLIAFSLIMVAAAEYLSIAQIIQSAFAEQGYNYSYFDILASVPDIMALESAMLSAALRDLGIGILFTLLFSYQIFRKMFMEAKNKTLTVLK